MSKKGKVLKDNSILRVRKDLCLGCGLCTQSCPRQAISLQSGIAQIDQNRCNHCGLCLDVCPQGAIMEITPVSKHMLHVDITMMKDRANDIIERIEKLRSNRAS